AASASMIAGWSLPKFANRYRTPARRNASMSSAAAVAARGGTSLIVRHHERHEVTAQPEELLAGAGLDLGAVGSEVHRDDLLDHARILRQHHDPVAEVDGLVDVVGHQ